MHFLGLLYIAVLAVASAAPALGGPSISYVAFSSQSSPVWTIMHSSSSRVFDRAGHEGGLTMRSMDEELYVRGKHLTILAT